MWLTGSDRWFGMTLMMGGMLLASGSPARGQSPSQRKLAESVIFIAPFDESVDALVAAGDRRLYTVVEAESKVGLHRDDVRILPGKGKFGGALAFGKKVGPVLYYQADRNLGYQEKNWSGTVSFWLSLDPNKDLEPGYCDPIQITDKSALDASLFVEFSKDHTPRRFRMAVCPEHKVWNPSNREWEAIPVAERPIVEVIDPPFASGKWTHVVVAFEKFNSGEANGAAQLYLDGKKVGAIAERDQKYVWETSKARIMLGLSYIGLMDELTIFDEALNEADVAFLYNLPRGARVLDR